VGRSVLPMGFPIGFGGVDSEGERLYNFQADSNNLLFYVYRRGTLYPLLKFVSESIFALFSLDNRSEESYRYSELLLLVW
jgi:hypothetical protein